MNDLTVTVSKTIQAPIETVFDAWLNPELLAQFMLPMPQMACPEVKCEPVLGGRFEILMQVGENKVPHTGEYLTMERPNTLAFTWVSPASLEDSVVTLNFSSADNNATKVDLTQVKFIDEQHRDNHQGGWSNILAALDKAVA